MTEFLSLMGLDPGTAMRRRWREALKRWAVDTSHWVRSPKHAYSHDELAKAVKDSNSFAGVLRKLGIPQAGGSQAYFARRIRDAGIDTSHFLGQAHARGKRSPSRRRPEDILTVLPAGSFRPKAPVLRRALIGSGVPEQCSECGCAPEWRGRRLRLIVDHIDGDWLDNRIANVRFLCPNCHSQTATWCRRRSAGRPHSS